MALKKSHFPRKQQKFTNLKPTWFAKRCFFPPGERQYPGWRICRYLFTSLGSCHHLAYRGAFLTCSVPILAASNSYSYNLIQTQRRYIKSNQISVYHYHVTLLTKCISFCFIYHAWHASLSGGLAIIDWIPHRLRCSRFWCMGLSCVSWRFFFVPRKTDLFWEGGKGERQSWWFPYIINIAFCLNLFICRR